MAASPAKPRSRPTSQHLQTPADAGSRDVFYSIVDDSEVFENGSRAQAGVPRATGYVSIKSTSYMASWKTRWVVLTGNYMRLFPSQDYPHAKKTLYLANCEIKENPAKAQIKFKIHGKRRSYELRPREKRDYELWLTALQGAQKFKDPRDEQRPPSLNRAPSEESLDELDVVDDLSGVPGLETEPVPPNLTPAQYEHEEQQRRQQLGAALRDMRQALSRLDKRSSHDTQAAVAAINVALKRYNDYVAVLESERDMWRSVSVQEKRRVTVLDSTIQSLAKDHRRLELVAAAARRSELDMSKKPIEYDSDEEFFDALDDGITALSLSSEKIAAAAAAAAATAATAAAATAAAATAAAAAAAAKPASAAATPAPAAAPAEPAPLPPGEATAEKRIVRRARLPSDKSPTRPSLWAVLKNAIGKDLSKMALPIIFNEPLSGLQRWSEDLEYAYLLDRAAEAENPAERVAYVAIFQISNYSTTMVRVNKPFNPILGETFECERPERGAGWRYLAEQVSHHPPVSACHANALDNRWEWWQTVQVSPFFRGKDLDVQPKGITHVKLSKFNEHITFRKVTTCVRNIIVGKQWVDNYGESKVVSHTTGYYAVLNFKPYSYFSGAVADVEGKVFNKAGEVQLYIKGNWNVDASIATSPNGPWKVIWTRDPVPEWSEQQYNMTQFAMTLNEIEPGQDKLACPTDCRFRTDQRLFELGRWDEAQTEKERLEDKQRAARRLREAGGIVYRPQFFKLEPDPDYNNEELWTFKYTYWKQREQGAWPDAPDLYGPDSN